MNRRMRQPRRWTLRRKSLHIWMCATAVIRVSGLLLGPAAFHLFAHAFDGPAQGRSGFGGLGTQPATVLH
jgi:hypothetical protein